MDLNKLDIPPVLLAELFTDSLVLTSPADLPAEQVPVTDPVTHPAPENGSWKSLGNNKRQVLVLVNVPDAVFLPDKELSFLTGILTACQLSMDDIALVNLDRYPGAGYKELSGEFRPKVVLLFDIEPAALGLPLNFPHYQLQAFSGSTFLYAPSLEKLGTDKVEKSKLWVCLKRLFNL